MHITALLLALAVAVSTAAPAAACIVPPRAQHMYWPKMPETLDPSEVALEVVFVRHPAEEEFKPKNPTADRVVVTSCGTPVGYTYRVLRVLGGDYKGPLEINTSVLAGIADEFKDGQSRIVVGTLVTSDNWPPFLQLRPYRSAY